MPQITLTPTVCSESSGWKTLYYYKTANSSYYPRQLVFTYPVNDVLTGAGVNVTQITIHGYARNSSSVLKSLRWGFRPAANSGVNVWSTLDGANVLAAAFTAVEGSNGSAYITKSIAKIYDGSSVLARHLKAAFDLGSPVYLGVIQPTDGRSIQVNPTLANWTIDVSYELLGNIPSTDVQTAVLGGTAITTTISKVIDGSTTTLRYKIGSNVLATVSLGAGTTHTYTVPASAGAHFPDRLTGILTIEAETSLDGERYGTIAASVTLTLPDDAAPECAAALTRIWAEGVADASKIDAYVQTKSGAAFALTGAAKYGAAVAGYALTLEGKSYSGANVTHSAFLGSGAVPYAYTVTDSRGLTRSYTGSVDVLSWSPPKIQSFAVDRVTAEGVSAIDGTYVRGATQCGVSSLVVGGVEKNRMVLAIAYREIAETGENDWIAADSLTASSISGTFAGLLQSGGANIGGGGTDAAGHNLPFSDMAGYEFRVTVSDLYGSSTAGNIIPTKEQLWDIDEAAGNMGFGGDAPDPLEGVGYRFHKAADFAAGIRGVTNYAWREVPTGGTWIDGRPIYRAVLYGMTSLSKAQGVFGRLPDAPHFLVDFRAYVYDDSGSWRPIPNNYYGDLSWHCNVYLRDDTVNLGFGTAWTGRRWVLVIAEYTKGSDPEKRYIMPFLTADSYGGCTVSASSVYNSTYPAWKAFDGEESDTKDYWASTVADAQPWIQVHLPHRLRNAEIGLTNMTAEGTNAAVSGRFMGSNDGSAWTEIGTFEGRGTGPRATTWHSLKNDTAYAYLRVVVTQKGTANSWVGFGGVRVVGEIADA